MNKNQLIKLKNFIKKETVPTKTKQIIPGNVRLSLGLYRTPEEQEKYMKEQEKNIESTQKRKKNNTKNI